MTDVIKFLTDSANLERLLSQPIIHAEPIGNPFPSNRGTVNLYRINGKQDVIVKEQPDDTVLEAEHTAYESFRGVRGILEVIDYAPGVLVLPFIEDATPLNIESMDSSDIDQIVSFLIASYNIQQSVSTDLYRAAVELGHNQVTREFRSLFNLAHYMEDSQSTFRAYEDLKRHVEVLEVPGHRVHGDFFPNNILKTKTKDIYFVDLEMSVIGDTATDIARFYRSVFENISETGYIGNILQLVESMIGEYVNSTHDRTITERLRFWIPIRMLNGGNHYENIRIEMDLLLQEARTLSETNTTEYFNKNKTKIVNATNRIQQYYPDSSIPEIVDNISKGDISQVQNYKEELRIRLDKATQLALFNALVSEKIIRGNSFHSGFLYEIGPMLPN